MITQDALFESEADVRAREEAEVDNILAALDEALA